LSVVHRKRARFDNLSELSIDVTVKKIEMEKQKEENKKPAGEKNRFSRSSEDGFSRQSYSNLFIFSTSNFLQYLLPIAQFNELIGKTTQQVYRELPSYRKL